MVPILGRTVVHMAIFSQPAPSIASLMASATLPQKRKAPPAEDDFPPGTFAHADAQQGSEGAINPELPKGEYESGRVICESCGEGISFRDEDTGGFTVKHWDAHRLECTNITQQAPSEPVVYTPENQVDASQPQAKRRRAKRTEEERIDYPGSACGPTLHIAPFPGMLIARAVWPKELSWYIHGSAKAAYPADDRSTLFANDPTVRKFDAERVLCKVCEKWIALGSDDNLAAVKTWMEHRATCQQDATNGTIASTSNIPSVPPPPKHLLALASSSSLPAPPPPSVSARSAPAKITLASPQVPTSPSAFKDLTPTNFPPVQESRRRNAEQRAAGLRSDPLIDSSYCAYPWLQHRGKCLKRTQKRTQRELEVAELRAQRDAMREGDIPMSEDGAEDSDEPESEEGVESGDEEEKIRRRAQKREERKRLKAITKAEAAAARLRQLEDGMMARKTRTSTSLASSDDDDDDMDVDMLPLQLADLDSPAGRLEFALRSVRYLFKTTYAITDDLTIASLGTYLNAAMPPDKHEDFDTSEVTKAAMALHERGDFMFQGDVLRVAN
ncbi:hypothetical protein A0H81_06217 [Grifola frondosa]|uniref:Uncharacterized protein n=1 Tax=Grifola frondosa TaxID=5627 RepID=A0A1C7MA14_GRIFR|nr:hypothetical protein A0H81_06217 [Grifola frondosa]